MYSHVMNISKPRTVDEHVIVTTTGRQVYNLGRKHTLEAAEHRLKSSTTDDVNSSFNSNRLLRATVDVGEACVWKFNRRTEVMDVYL